MKGLETREKIFLAFSANLKYVFKKYNFQLRVETDASLQPVDFSFYICPICLRCFSIDAINQKCDNPLTIEDLPPKSVGGNPKILTCKQCNNQSGHSLDKLIIDSLKASSFIQRIPESRISSTISINEGSRYKVGAQIDEHKGFRFVFKHLNPRAKNDLDYLKKHWNNTRINFTFQLPNKHILATSLIRIGLLLAFSYLGNRVLFERNYHKILNHINDPKKNKLPHDGITLISPEENVKPGIHFLKTPKKYRSYLIVFSISIETLQQTVAFPFPGPTEEGWNNYINFKDINKETILSFTDITSKKYINEPAFVNAYDYLFYHL